MADQNKPEMEEKFYSEILSPAELFAARSRSHKLPVRGQKEFYPDGSEEQRQRTQQSLEEHWNLLSEERVERLGNLVRAVWIPEEKIIKLQSPAGKFWQTMGFSADGHQFLLPEEALYLMECGNLQVFHQDLPFSIQDGYENFLSTETVTLQQYQVFGHLKRLGYVVHRFDPSSEASSYEKKLNLAWQRERGGLKRKRSKSPACSPDQRMETSSPKDQNRGSSEDFAFNVRSADDPPGRTWWSVDVPQPKSERSSASSHWDFSTILFPDLGSREQNQNLLSPPDPSLLPGELSVGVCDVAPWREKINLRKISTSAKERKEEGRRWHEDKDNQARQCRNWAEYEELRARRQADRRGRPDHLWKTEVTPLHNPTQPISTADLLEKIRVIPSTELLEGASRLSGPEEWRICFNVYQPDSVADFKKSKPGRPHSRMCVCSFHGPVPDLRAIKQLASLSGDVPVVFAVIDHGDVCFYSFKGFQLPVDVYP